RRFARRGASFRFLPFPISRCIAHGTSAFATTPAYGGFRSSVDEYMYWIVTPIRVRALSTTRKSYLKEKKSTAGLMALISCLMMPRCLSGERERRVLKRRWDL